MLFCISGWWNGCRWQQGYWCVQANSVCQPVSIFRRHSWNSKHTVTFGVHLLLFLTRLRSQIHTKFAGLHSADLRTDCKTLYFRCILILLFWNVEISLHFNLAFSHCSTSIYHTLMGKLNFRGYLILRFYPTREIRKNLMRAKNMCFAVCHQLDLQPLWRLDALQLQAVEKPFPVFMTQTDISLKQFKWLPETFCSGIDCSALWLIFLHLSKFSYLLGMYCIAVFTSGQSQELGWIGEKITALA